MILIPYEPDRKAIYEIIRTEINLAEKEGRGVTDIFFFEIKIRRTFK